MKAPITTQQAMLHPAVVATINLLSEMVQHLQDENDALKAAVADEREACAKVCENEAKEHERNTYDAYDGRYDWKADGANDCADAIRARGNT